MSTGGEENILCWSTDRYRGADIFLHETAHSVAVRFVSISYCQNNSYDIRELISLHIHTVYFIVTNAALSFPIDCSRNKTNI